jgi:MFS family permease
MRTIAQYRSFPRPVQLLLLNQLTINIGFYMLMPYLAAHLSGGLGLATWLVGLVLGVRNFAQQGMFLLGGSLADRFGYKPLIVAGCGLRTVGFGLLGLVDSVPALIVASAATGFAGALFNPAVRAYLARDAGEHRVEAFALFNVVYQAGILLGPLIGLALTGVTFSLTCGAAAAVFALLTVLQIRALPQRRGNAADAPASLLTQWRTVASNRPFALFALTMIGSYVLSFQVYLALPLQAKVITSSGHGASVAVATVFAVSGLVTILGQLRVTSWCRRCWGAGTSMVGGLAILGTGFVPLLAAEAVPAQAGRAAQVALGLTALVLTAAILALGTAIVFPFEMDTIVTLSRGKLVATHYGLYNTVCGIGILLGNLGTGWALDLARAGGITAVPWILLIGVGALCALALHDLRRRGLLPAETRDRRAARPRVIESTPPPGTNRTPSDPRCTARNRASESRGSAPGQSPTPEALGDRAGGTSTRDLS